MSKQLCHCRCAPEVIAVASPRWTTEGLEYAEVEAETTGTSSTNSSYHEAPLEVTPAIVDRSMGPLPPMPVLIHWDESACSYVPSCCQALPTALASQVQAAISMPVNAAQVEAIERVLPDKVQGLENIILWQAARRRFLGKEVVHPHQNKSACKFTEGRRSTGISLIHSRFHPYHLASESKLRRGFRRAE